MTTYNQLKYPPSSIGNSSIATGAVSPDKLDSDAQRTGFKNRIINGDMRIDQRNAGSSVTPTTDGYLVDRWAHFKSANSTLSFQQNAGSVTPPVGFTNYLGVTSLSAYSLLTTSYFLLRHQIEGFNVADLGYGTANAKTVTLSFWVRSSLTGTFGGAFKNGAQNRSYPFTYSISAANTWEQKSITVPGDTTGTWLTNNGSGLILDFGLGVGSTYSGTAGSWAGSGYISATGATSVVGTNGATFYLTGVQLEVGSSATPFDTRAYGTELALCQRYYQRLSATGANVTKPRFSIGFPVNTTTTQFTIFPFVPLRATPTLSYSNLIVTNNVSFDKTVTSLSTNLSNTNNISVYIDCSSAGLTQFSPVMLSVSYAEASGFIDFNAEL